MQDHAIPSVGVAGIARGVVEEIVDGLVKVRVDARDEVNARTCEVMHGSEGGLILHAGDEVIVWHSERADDPGVVLGRIGVACNSRPPDVPDELVIEATQSLTLRVGDGSITIREDGRILIRGKDLVSHAKRNNRIRGGSVQIN